MNTTKNTKKDNLNPAEIKKLRDSLVQLRDGLQADLDIAYSELDQAEDQAEKELAILDEEFDKELDELRTETESDATQQIRDSLK